MVLGARFTSGASRGNHEAGHAVAAFLFAAAVFPFTGDSDIAPDDWVEKVVLRRRGAGLTVLGPAFQVAAGRLDILKMLVAGAVAEFDLRKIIFLGCVEFGTMQGRPTRRSQKGLY